MHPICNEVHFLQWTPSVEQPKQNDDSLVTSPCRYNAAFWAPDESHTENYEEYEVCIALKSTGDLADWTEDDCYEPKGYICKIEGMISSTLPFTPSPPFLLPDAVVVK